MSSLDIEPTYRGPSVNVSVMTYILRPTQKYWPNRKREMSGIQTVGSNVLHALEPNVSSSAITLYSYIYTNGEKLGGEVFVKHETHAIRSLQGLS